MLVDLLCPGRLLHVWARSDLWLQYSGPGDVLCLISKLRYRSKKKAKPPRTRCLNLQSILMPTPVRSALRGSARYVSRYPSLWRCCCERLPRACPDDGGPVFETCRPCCSRARTRSAMPRIIAAFVVVVLNHQEPLNNKLLSFIIIIHASKTVSGRRGW